MINSDRHTGIGRLTISLLVLWLMLATVFTGLSVASTYVDPGLLRDNAVSSLETLSSEGDWPRRLGIPLFQKDNFSDAIIIDIAATMPDEYSHTDMALAVPVAVMTDGNTSVSRCCLNGLTRPDRRVIRNYGRYWHGHTVIVRPLLTIMAIDGIRVLNRALLYSLALLCCLLTYRRLGASYALLLLLSLLLSGFVFVPDSIQFASCWYIALSASAILLSVKPSRLSYRRVALTMFATGAITAYLDLLTTPLITLCYPLSISLLRRDMLPDRRLLITGILCWGGGYAGLWITKLLVAECLSTFPFLIDALSTAKTRSEIAILSGQNLMRSVTLCVAVSLLLASALVLFLHKLTERTRVLRYYPFAILGLLPYLWVIVMGNHSYIHALYVWRIVSVVIFNWGIFIYQGYIVPLHSSPIQHLTTRHDPSRQ